MTYHAHGSWLCNWRCQQTTGARCHGHGHDMHAWLGARLLHLGADPLGDVPARNIIYLARSEIQNAQYIAQHIKASTKCGHGHLQRPPIMINIDT